MRSSTSRPPDVGAGDERAERLGALVDCDGIRLGAEVIERRVDAVLLEEDRQGGNGADDLFEGAVLVLAKWNEIIQLMHRVGDSLAADALMNGDWLVHLNFLGRRACRFLRLDAAMAVVHTARDHEAEGND